MKFSRPFVRKVVVVMCIVGLQAFFLYAFSANRDSISHFKFSYISRVYLPAYARTVASSASELPLLGNLFSVFRFDFGAWSRTPETGAYAESVPVLLYHEIVDTPGSEASEGADVNIDNFREQMFALKDAGYETVSIEDFYRFMRGETRLPDKSIVLTFDDGGKESYYPVHPILEALDYRATSLVITKYSLGDVRHPFYLSPDELRRMKESGRWDIQVHTKEGHDEYFDPDGKRVRFYSAKFWLPEKGRFETNAEFAARIAEELAAGKKDLEGVLGISSLSFAFPFGDYGQHALGFPDAERILLKAVRAVYPIAFYQATSERGFRANYPDPTSSLAKRIDVQAHWGADELMGILEHSRQKHFPYQDAFNEDRGWVRTWGRLGFKNDGLRLSAASDGGGAAAFLDGSRWGNYSFTAKLGEITGKSVSLLARYVDNQNYVACTFLDGEVKIEETVNGVTRILGKGTGVALRPGAEFGVAVYRDTAGCFEAGKPLLDASLSPNLLAGGIGFKTWDPELGLSSVRIEEVRAVEIHELFSSHSPEVSTAVAEETLIIPELLDTAESGTGVSLVVPEEPIAVPTASEVDEIQTTPVIEEPALRALPYQRADFRDDPNWFTWWGSYGTDENGYLAIGAEASSSGGGALMHGSETWTDYAFNAMLDWKSGKSFTLVARYRDSENYVACTFVEYDSHVYYARIEQVLDGVKEIFAESSALTYADFSRENVRSAIRVNNEMIECDINNHMVFDYFHKGIDPRLASGGIGIKTWDPELGVSKIIVKDVSVTPLD